MTRLWLGFLAALTNVHAADDGDWRMPARDYASTRYSPLAEISAANVRQL